jgi:hypothetical protein
MKEENSFEEKTNWNKYQQRKSIFARRTNIRVTDRGARYLTGENLKVV